MSHRSFVSGLYYRPRKAKRRFSNGADEFIDYLETLYTIILPIRIFKIVRQSFTPKSAYCRVFEFCSLCIYQHVERSFNLWQFLVFGRRIIFDIRWSVFGSAERVVEQMEVATSEVRTYEGNTLDWQMIEVPAIHFILLMAEISGKLTSWAW